MIYSTTGVLPNYTWQYDMLGAAGYVSPAILAPNDSLGALNDTLLYNNNAGVDRLVADSTYLYNAAIPSMHQFMANLSKRWQEMMLQIQSQWQNPVGNINSTTNINASNNASAANNNGTLNEDKIISTLEKMGSGDAVSDRVNQKITVDGKETTILRRLIELCNEYRKDPDNARLTKDNYETIWAIADKYAKNGTISSEEFATLKRIALDPKVGSENEPEDNTPVSTPMTEIAEHKKSDVSYKNNVTNIATEYKDALYSWGTDYAHLEAATNGINADNVVEVFDEFYNKYGIGEGETLIDAIYNDFDDWTNSWYGITGAAPTFKALHDTLVQRAQNHIESFGDKDGKLQKAIDDFNTAFNSINDDNYDDKHQALKTMFSNMIQAIKTAEAETLKAEKNLVEQSKQDK